MSVNLSISSTVLVGSGSVAQALATSLLRAGVSIRFAARDPQGARASLAESLKQVPVMLPSEAASGSELIVLAVPAPAAVAAARSLGDLTGKIIVDCTNPLRWEGGPIWAPPPEGSQALALAAALPGIPVIKGFNHFGAEIQGAPQSAAGPADALFAGDDARAKHRVMQLAERMGFRAFDAGPLRNAAVLENLAVLWIHLAMAAGVGRNFSFRVESRA